MHDAGWRVTAASRERQRDQPGLAWIQVALPDYTANVPRDADVIFSCGPLDNFAQWYEKSTIDCPRVIAFGSTTIEVKRGSADKQERDVAERLRESEQRLFDAASARNAQATMLRPTLIYGAGRDQSLMRIASLARQWGRFVLPRNANGLREPVHVHDLAAAAFDACDAPNTAGKAYALPGGERVPYREMVQRVLAVLDPPPTLIEVPAPLFALALLGGRAMGKIGGFGDAAVARMRADLVFDATPARNDFGYAPRPFRPTASMFIER
nr:nucleoside-diphosphate sugar epimerase [Lysobacter lactosilyticus]